MLTVDEALERVLAEARPLEPRAVPLDEALGLVLAEDITSDVDSPPHDKAAVDGYAVRTADVAAGERRLAVVEEITAGAVPQHKLERGEAARVMTGAPLPEGSDAMVMIERTRLITAGANEHVELDSSPIATGQNIVRRASALRRGQTVLRAPLRLRPIEIGLLAEVGRHTVLARPRPQVAVLPTGNEIVPLEQQPGPGQIRNSNGPMLLATARWHGGQTIDLGIARDDPDQLEQLIRRGLEADILTISGGVSAGKLDLVPGVLSRLGVREVFHKIKLKPGKPLWFGVHRSGEKQTLVFGLPGNPVSSLVCFELFVRPAIARLAGLEVPAASNLRLPLASGFDHRGDRPTYHPARMIERDGRHLVETVAWIGSADLAALTAASALALFPAGDRTYGAGEEVSVYPLKTTLGE